MAGTVANTIHRPSHQTDRVEQALDTTLSDLGLDYLDLYLMHWPVASSGGRTYIEYVDVSSQTLLIYTWC